MPNRKISQLQANANLTVSDIFPIVNSGTTKKQDIQGLLNFLTPYFSGNTELYITGGTYSNGTAVFTNSTGGTFSVSGFSTGSSFTGGTVSGATRFTNGLTATTISATTYQNLPLDVRVTGGTYDVDSRVATFTNSTGGTFAVTGFYKPLWYAEPSSAPSSSPIVGGTNSIAIGEDANALSDNMFVVGNSAGREANNATNSNFLGSNAGTSATNANDSNFIGYRAGVGAINAYGSNFFGSDAGRDAIDASNSNFLGFNAGYGANKANYSNFIGYQAGYQATDASNSNFIGVSAGRNAINAYSSNFFGEDAGSDATNANDSNFFGGSAGYQATDASYSNFIGVSAGGQATGASYSNFFGYRAGDNASYPIGSNNIIIGTNISLSAVSNSINIGGVLFGKNTYSAITDNVSISAQTQGGIGINVVNPQANLHIGPSTTAQALMRLEVGPAPTSPNDGDIWLESNTLTGLKIRISGVTRTINII